MNKEELIAILQERSQETEQNEVKEEKSQTDSEYLKKFKNRREEDGSLFKHNFVIFILLISLIYSLYYHFTNEKKVDLSTYVQKDTVTFSDLPQVAKDDYILKSQLQEFQAKLRETDKKYISKLEKDVENLVVKLNAAKKAKAAVLNKAKSKSKRYNAIGCYDETQGTKIINKACKDKISRFLKNNKKNAIKFEIIAVLDTKDKGFITNKVTQVDASKNIKNSMKEFLTQGLARTRVLEAAYLVKKVLGEKVLITYVNYIAETQNKRGVTIRAYY